MEYCLWKGEFYLLIHLFIQIILLPLPTLQPLRRVLTVRRGNRYINHHSNLKSAIATSV